VNCRVLALLTIALLLAGCGSRSLTPSAPAPGGVISSSSARSLPAANASANTQGIQNPDFQAFLRTKTIHHDSDGRSWVYACAEPAPGHASCFAEIDLTSGTVRRQAGQFSGGGKTPFSFTMGAGDIQGAYGLPSATNGSGETVAIVDGGYWPNEASDLSVYRTYYGLGTANFAEYNQTGGTKLPAEDKSWATEDDLDSEMVSAACPKCKIVVVVANGSDAADEAAATEEAYKLGADAISNSYGYFPESTLVPAYQSDYCHTGVAIVAASGDSGYPEVPFPADLSCVTAVGGTVLSGSGGAVPSGSASHYFETAWPSTGSGCSTSVTRPSWQSPNLGCGNFRASPDVSAIATFAAVYTTFQNGGWISGSGTSVAAPIIAATYALAGDTSAISDGSTPYMRPMHLHNVVEGVNGTCSVTPLCTAGPGWNGPSGLGSPAGIADFTRGVPAWIRGAPALSVAIGGENLLGTVFQAGAIWLLGTDDSGTSCGENGCNYNAFQFAPVLATNGTTGSIPFSFPNVGDSISVDSEGNAWTINDDYQLLNTNSVYPQATAAESAGFGDGSSSGAVDYLVGGDYNGAAGVEQFTPVTQTVTLIPGGPGANVADFKQGIAEGYYGKPWVLDKEGDIWTGVSHPHATSLDWLELANGRASAIAIAPSPVDTLWVLGTTLGLGGNYYVYRGNGQTFGTFDAGFTQVPGFSGGVVVNSPEGVSLAVDPYGNAWVTDAQNQLWAYDPVTNSWELQAGPIIPHGGDG